ncbi:copper homeostasis protein CutC [Ketogulonicigenium vulgare]|uniref:PF03932 family protein CutC n=1 Tax=Ketogulonicigenium vulgare (strain WSH-001) TaxID=759362 RepID=F9Y5L6_KETVW|nr:copper homeostasis protein CutC [Ketogulonicigenium vulgare]ADO42575.1 CutC family protein [Ketogulonicigenium vulgare Y25]AEM40769.1 CutC family protein Copper transport [Ketogulonicigenium vulgare WSH-001]ALJ80937.1 copper homeostasis protein CutC [Ketogulonicigenium vulgare]ANW33707.1 copper homeostasis protein CutC [Ketogulonicigenium vulgare]AOZ54487.1 CutC family protein [Ketogulonicigenium vulgare]
MALLEICVDDAEGLATAVAAGADRIELCAALAVGGLTPTAGLMFAAASTGCATYAMIRPRAGDFVFTPAEIAVMEGDIDAARAAGLAGVVLGANLADGRLDTELLGRLIQRADGMGLTLHRAFDLVPDFNAAVDQAVALGFERILTSGGATSAVAGLDALRDIVAYAGDRISIMPGSGVNAQNVRGLLALGVSEVHASGGAALPAPDGKVLALGFDGPGRKATSGAAVAALKAVL